MDTKIRQPKWKVVEYSRNQIIYAGKIIRNEETASAEEINHALKIIDNWRAAHAFPMHVIYMHLRRMGENKKNVIVAERLKRLNSIIAKLKLERSMNLWTMQDLGGCRVIVTTVSEVYQYAHRYESSKKRHLKKRCKDYIKEPKQSGYRSLHVVYEYQSDKSQLYNKNMLIEIQFRTHLQHLWATSVETMGLFKQEAIKSGQGSDDVKRFFVLASAVFAIQEKQPLPPGIPSNPTEIKEEIKALDSKNKYLEFLSGIRVAVEMQKKNLKIERGSGYFLLRLNYNQHKLYIKYFGTSRIDEATSLYNNLEKSKNEFNVDTVLVQVSSFKALKSAYPNYFSDIGEFVFNIKNFLANA